MKYLIVGLGNVGEKYANTRHNIGFKVVDSLAEKFKAEPFYLDRHAYRSSIKYKGRILVLIKPTTLMNLSGKAVNYWLQEEKIPLEKILVITDDLALPFGKIRMKTKGGDGGHNGLKDIQDKIGSSKYTRLRFGIGHEFSRGKQIDYVLNQWEEEEKKQLNQSIDKSVDAILSYTTIGPERTMNYFN